MLGGDPHQPEWGRNVLLNSYQHDTQQYTAGVPIHNDSMKSVDSISRHWSDPTLTGSGRCSVYSWGLYEAELDRAAAESVRMKFDRINAALFEGRSTGSLRVDEECREWSCTFPHLEVKGIHMLDSMEDGMEMVAPEPLLGLPTSSSSTIVGDTETPGGSDKLSGLMVMGRRLQPVVFELAEDDCSPLYEEIFVVDGCLEEFFAFDNTDEMHMSDCRNRTRLKRHHGLPPVTPNACVREAVLSLTFGHLWNEAVVVVQPLLAAVMLGHDRSYSLVDGTLTPAESALGERSPPEQPYILPELSHPPILKTSGQAGLKFPRLKCTALSVPPSFGPSHPPLAANLSGVMQIRAMALQHRLPSTYALNREDTPPHPMLSDRPESCVIGSRYGKISTPLSPRTSLDYHVPPTPGPSAFNNSRLISGRMTNRRNNNTALLKPIDKPKTPALPIDNRIRGLRLGGNYLHYSPPSTPLVRHTQLPPLERAMGCVANTFSPTMGASMVFSSERSPTTQQRVSAQQRNHVTFNSRIVSDAEPDLWYYTRVFSGAGDLRPSTTNMSLRNIPVDNQQKASYIVGRKVSDNNLLLGRMKVVGHATGVHGASSGGGEMSSVIVEDEELEGDTTRSFTVMGKSGIVQSKPYSMSSRNKSRGQFR